MNELNTLIQQTKEEIENIQEEMKKQNPINPFNKIIELKDDFNIKISKLSALQTAQDIFIKMLDERKFKEQVWNELYPKCGWKKEDEEAMWVACVHYADIIKSQLIGDKNE